MRHRKIAWSFLAGSGFIALAAIGCATDRTTLAEPDEEKEVATSKKGAQASDSWEGYSPKVMDQARIIEMAFPTGHKGTSAILVQQVVPLEVLRTAEYFYEYHVTNLSKVAHDNVTLGVESLTNLNVVRSTPAAVDAKGEMRWELGNLGPHETKIIKVYAKSESPQPASSCTSVSYDSAICAQIKVVDPHLQLVKIATSEGTTCADFTLRFEVTNSGTGKARKVVIKDTLPEGLRTVKDERTVHIEAGDLAPGEKKIFDVKAKALRAGKHQSWAVVTAEGGLESKSENIVTIVSQPVLAITAEASDQQFVGRDITYRFTVKNTGDGPAVNTAVVADLPGASQFVRASEGATSHANKVTWQLGSLAPGASRAFEMRVKPTGQGTLPTTARATAVCAEAVTATASTSVVGIAAILLELVDAGDPAELAGEVTYTITATNQGSAPDSDIVITCEIPAEQDYLASDGPSKGTLTGRTLKFAPLQSLAPGDRATWKVRVRAKAAGDLRFKVSMSTDQLKDVPVQETESTTQYQ